MCYSPTESKQLYRQLGAKNKCPVKEANWNSLIYLSLLSHVKFVVYINFNLNYWLKLSYLKLVLGIWTLLINKYLFCSLARAFKGLWKKKKNDHLCNTLECVMFVHHLPMPKWARWGQGTCYLNFNRGTKSNSLCSERLALRACLKGKAFFWDVLYNSTPIAF